MKPNFFDRFYEGGAIVVFSLWVYILLGENRWKIIAQGNVALLHSIHVSNGLEEE